jgi:ABC-type branched-subunit amino acid transport system substrate-binding protein
MVVGCGGDKGDDGPVTIGLLAPKSGALEQVGLSFEKVATIAVANINDLGGIDGRDLELLVEDTGTVAENAPLRLQALIDAGAIAVVGPATSGEVEQAWPVAKANKVPIMSPSSTAPALSQIPPIGPDDDGYLFRNVPDDNVQSIAMAYYLRRARDPLVDQVAILYESGPYGTGLKDAFRASFENVAPGMVVKQVTYEQNLANEAAARTVIDELAAGGTPDMVVLIALEQDAVKLVNAWHNNGNPVLPTLEWFMTDGARSGGFLTGAGPKVAGMCGTAPTYPESGSAYGALEDRWNAAYPGQNLADQVYAPNVWDAFHLIAAAMIAQANTYPGEPLGGAHLRDEITTVSDEGQIFNAREWRTMISALRRGNDVDFDGASGPTNIEAGQTIGPYEVWCISPDGAAFERQLFLEAEDLRMLLDAP